MAKNLRQTQQRLREQGAKDAKAGLSIDNYYKLSLPRSSESFRAAYEIGYRAAKEEMRKRK